MADSSEPPPSLCRQCGLPLPEGARLCSKCHSYQDWRSWFSVSTTVLALLTAMISVIGIAGPAILRAVHTPRSEAYLASPSIDGTTLRVLAVNRGDAPAVLIRARVDGDYLAGATKVRLRNDADAILPPGVKLLTFDIIPLLNEDKSYAGSMDAIQAVVSKKPLPATRILLGIQQSDGRDLVQSLPLDDEDMFDLLRDNADRCSGIGKPNFRNGCIGPGENADDPIKRRPYPRGKG